MARGFSFMTEGPLDMRMDRSDGATAAQLLERLSEAELSNIIFQYGEERYARRIARSVVRARDLQSLRTTADLVSAIRGAVPASYRHGRIHFATARFRRCELRSTENSMSWLPRFETRLTYFLQEAGSVSSPFIPLKIALQNRLFETYRKVPNRY
jgi:Predicted S-adenosylmethionine-dependent methyltransferase involved in cell envelope biogenesis